MTAKTTGCEGYDAAQRKPPSSRFQHHRIPYIVYHWASVIGEDSFDVDVHGEEASYHHIPSDGRSGHP